MNSKVGNGSDSLEVEVDLGNTSAQEQHQLASPQKKTSSQVGQEV